MDREEKMGVEGGKGAERVEEEVCGPNFSF